jgi:drug/metabolite transporter (DMT)-like permease
MFAILALASAALYGAADFIGGLTSRRADTTVVVVVSQGAGLLLVAVLLPLLGTPVPGRADWIWGSLAGLTGGVGVALLYRALAIGVMSVVAPTTAVCAVAVPVAIAVALGERPGAQAITGILLAIVAIALVSQQESPGTVESSPARGRSGVGLALASGVAIGLFLFALARTSAAAGLWPLLAARLVSVTLIAALALVSRRSFAMPSSVMATSIGCGIVDMLANLLYLLASREGPLTLVVTLSSLYPASTVILAWVGLGERLKPTQWVGVLCALVAIVMIVSAA